MKNIKMISVVLILLASFSFSINAQVSITTQVFAEIVEPVSAYALSQLSFGSFYPNNEGGEVQIVPDGNRAVNGDVSLVNSNYSAASYEVTGQKNANFSIILPKTSIVLTNPDNSGTLTVDNWESVPSTGGGKVAFTDEAQSVKVGATLNVGSIEDNPVGSYSGSFAITFAYE